MSGRDSGRLTGQAFERAYAHWRGPSQRVEQPEADTGVKLTIAISRQRGAQGTRVAAELGKLLDWPVYDRNLIEKIVEETGVRQELVESVDERRSSWLRETLEAFTNAPVISSSKYAHILAEVLTALAAHGECIIVGRGAGFLLPPESTLRVSLVAPRQERIARIREDQQLSERAASRQVKQIDDERNAFVRHNFHKDPTDVDFYDLTLNTARFSHRQCAELIVEALTKRQDAEVSNEAS